MPHGQEADDAREQGGGQAAPQFQDAETDWWLWLMFSFFIFACIIVFLIIIFEDPEVRSYSSHQARRLSDWYNERAMRQQQEEMMMLSSQHQQEPNPPLYQTIVPPTYQYHKPPTPREPPPKYEESPTDQPPPEPDPLEDIIAARETPSPSGDNSNTCGGQPEYVKKGKVKKSRASPLLRQIRNLDGHKILTSGHNIFVRKPVNRTVEETSSNNQVDLSEIPEEMVFELNTDPINPFEVQ